ncbi:MAG: hypothetical protein IPO27_06770 [Bacteroidetes bacterium]|nr:hypothetical protein [Bacteroidota bacterium]
MTKKIVIRNISLGLISWLIPYCASFLFFKPGGDLLVPYSTFKASIMVIGVVSGCFLLFQFFKVVSHDYVRNGIIVGISWFVINILLDVLFLLPITKTTFGEYFMSIGLGYFSIPPISMVIGFLLNKKLTAS